MPVTGLTLLRLLIGAVLTTGGVAVVDVAPLIEAETAAANASAVTVGVVFNEDDGGGVLVIVTVVFSGVTMVNVNGLERSTVGSVTRTEAVDDDSVDVVNASVVVMAALSSVFVSAVVTSDWTVTTGSSDDWTVVVVAAVVVDLIRPEPNNRDPVSLTRPVLPSLLDSKLLTMAASEIVSGSSMSSSVISSSSLVVVGIDVVVTDPSVRVESTVVNGTEGLSVVKENVIGEKELRAKIDGFIGVLLRGGNRVVDVTGSNVVDATVVIGAASVVVLAATCSTGTSVTASTVVGAIDVVVVLTRLRGKVGNKVDGFSVVVVVAVVVVDCSRSRNLDNSPETAGLTVTVGLMLSTSMAFNSLTPVLLALSVILRRNCGWRMPSVSSKAAAVMFNLALALVRMMVLI